MTDNPAPQEPGRVAAADDPSRPTSTPATPPTRSRSGLGGPFRNVFVANLSSSLGDGIAYTAAPLLATRLTDDPLLVSGIAAISLLPWLFFAIPSGILLDRVDRRRALMVANGARTVFAILLAVLAVTGTLTIWWLYAVVFTYGILETVYDGAIRAVVPSVVRRADLPRANSRIEAGETVVQNFLAAPLTSWLFAIAVVVPLAMSSAAYALAAVLAVFLPAVAAGAHRRARPAPASDGTAAPAPASDESAANAPTEPSASDGTAAPTETPDPAHAAEPAPPWYRQIADGYHFIVGNPILRPLWFLSVLIGLCFSAATSTLVVFVLDGLGVNEKWYGTVAFVAALGALVGASVASRIKTRIGTGGGMAWGNLVACVFLVITGVCPLVFNGMTALITAMAAYTVTSGAVIVWNVLVMSIRQSVPPSEMLGRVHGTWRTLLWGASPLGALLGGLLARIDLSAPLIVAGGAATIMGLAGFRFLSSLPNPEDLDAAS